MMNLKNQVGENMASIVSRGNSFCVVYTYRKSGKRKQKWETYKTLAEAENRKAEIERQDHEDLGRVELTSCKTLDDLLKEYTEIYGKNKWSAATYKSNIGLMYNYISPLIGKMNLKEINSRVLEKFYRKLLKTKAVPNGFQKQNNKSMDSFVRPGTINKIHILLKSCFNQAVKWELMDKNPATNATVPKVEKKEREIWDAETLFHAIDVCKDDRLRLAMNLAFSCTMRMGEILGLTWDCVDITPEHINDGKAHIYINKELQRIDKKVMETLDGKGVMLCFPEHRAKCSTMLVLKQPKTQSSIRKVYLPHSVAIMLTEWKKKQDEVKRALGGEYADYDLVIAGPMGYPTEESTIQDLFNKLIQENSLPKVVFHSLRHTSITYKLMLNGGDIKSVQGDSGHAVATMVTDQYSHILDEGRIKNAELIEEAFYADKCTDSPMEPEASAGLDADTMNKIMNNPEFASLIKALAEKM